MRGMTTRISLAGWPAGPALALALALPVARAADTRPADLLAVYAASAGQAASAERGRTFFLARHGQEWSCASCHGERPAQAGRHAGTGKPIEPLAPSASAARFTDRAKVEKWFRRNCRDVLSRECTALEKADVIAWLLEAGGVR
jgi:hypothetical protein